MRKLSGLLCGLAACSGSPSTPETASEPAPTAAQTDPAKPTAGVLGERVRVRVTATTGLADYVPESMAGEATQKRQASENAAGGEWRIDGQTIHLDLSRIDDVRQTRAAFELLGKDADARMNGQAHRGLRIQGNPAQISRDLNEPHKSTLSVVAANTFLVNLSVEPTESLEEVLPYAELIDIGGLTRLAVQQHKAKTAEPVKAAD